MTTVLKGKGTTLKHASTVIGQVKDLSISFGVKTVDSTHLGSTGAEFVPTLTENGECTFQVEVNWADASQVTILGLINTPSSDSWTITFSDASTLVFTGTLHKFDIENITAENIVMAKGSIKVSGTAVFTAGP